MVACPSCRTESPVGFRFCPACATPLGTAAAVSLPEERKVVTALFCDLVGFTATSESADPEDVDRMLTAYFAMARAQIEAHGGVVEKFIGDAVVGVFGVPAAHEDDPERAVRAALRIIEDAEELPGSGARRSACASGSTPARPSSGSASPRARASGSSPATRSIPPRGSNRSLPRWAWRSASRPTRPRRPSSTTRSSSPRRSRARPSRSGSSTRRPRGPASAPTSPGRTTRPFIGREIDLALLQGHLRQDASPPSSVAAGHGRRRARARQEPDRGRARRLRRRRPELVTWRQGRCLPYGEGITFWALGEIVKAHAGILESDAPEVATRKLDVVLPEGR